MKQFVNDKFGDENLPSISLKNSKYRYRNNHNIRKFNRTIDPQTVQKLGLNFIYGDDSPDQMFKTNRQYLNPTNIDR